MLLLNTFVDALQPIQHILSETLLLLDDSN